MVTLYKLYYIFREINNQMLTYFDFKFLCTWKEVTSYFQRYKISRQLSLISSIPSQFREERMKEYTKKDRIIR